MTHSNTDCAARIDELEARLAQQDQSMIELSDEVYRQQQHIAQLDRQLRHLADRIQEFAPAGPQTEPTDERPPHY